MKTNQWIRPFLFTLLIIVAPIIAYYVYFVESRETFLLDRFHAHLANTAARTEARFSSAFDVIQYNPDRPNELGVGDCERPQNGQGAIEQAPVEQMPNERPAGTVSKREGGRLRFQGEDCEAPVETEALIGDVDPERQFYEVVILDDNNSVIFQRDAENGRIADGQLFAELGGDDADDDSDSAVSDSLVDMRAMHQGRPFLVFVQPLVVSSSDGKPWKIVGLLEESRFNRLKYGVRSGGIALAALIVLSVLFAGPFLKLWYLGRFEPLSRFDIFLQTGAGLSLVAMITVALLAWNTSARLSAYFDARLESVATQLREMIREEFAVAVTTLEGLEPTMIRAYETRSEIADPDGKPTKNCPTLAGTYVGPRELSEHGGPTVAGDILTKLQEKTQGYRQLVMAYLMDQRGCQLVKWSSAPLWTRPGQFSDRRYFRRALPDERVPLELYEIGSPFFQDVIVSRTTGEREIVFSKPVDEPMRSGCTDAVRVEDKLSVPCVSVLTARLRALESVLPYGHGVMLLDGNSNIVLRSDGDASTELNLASEVDAPDRLRAVVRLGIQTNADGALFEADYRRKPYQFFVVPLGVGDLALVAFYDRSLVVTTVLESVGAAVAAWLIWASILITFFVAFWIADDMTQRALRAWPVFLGVALLALIAVAWFVLTVPPVLMLAAAGIPLLLLPLLSLAREERHRMNAQLRRLLVVLAIWLSVMLAAALPTFVFYGDAEQRALSALTRFEANEYDHALELQAQSFNAWKHKVGLGREDSWQGFQAWANQPFFDEQIASSASDCSSFHIVCLILRSLPDYTNDVTGIHAMYRAGEWDAETRGRVRRQLLAMVPDTYAFQGFTATMFLVLTAVAIWYLLVRTFGLRAENIVEVSSFTPPGDTETARYMVYGVPAQQRSRRYFDALPAMGKLWLDLRDVSASARIEVAASTDAIALDEFDSNLNDIEVVRQRVELLERLLREGRRVILLFVSTEPLNFVTATYDAEKDAALLSRFATALSRFKLTYHESATGVDRPTRPAATVAERIKDVVRRRFPVPSGRAGWRKKLVAAECRHPDLWQIRDDLLKKVDVHKWSKGQIIQQVQSRANAIYQRMWSRCTRVEKFTLIELGRGNPINPNNWDAARRLSMRRYVRTDPFYRIASESLRQFVGRMERTENVHSWRAESPGAWNQIKVPLIVMLVGTMIFVALTQPSLFNSVFAFVAAGAASFPFLVSALNARLQRAGKGGGT